MTAIVGVAHGGKVYIGGDSSGMAGWETHVRADAKVFTNGPYVMGFTTSFRMGQLLRYKLAPPPHPEGESTDRFMVTTFVDAVRACLKDGGFAKADNGREEGGDFLVGYQGRLFEIDSDYQVGEFVNGYGAIGAGSQTALGALYATKDLAPRKRVLVALKAANRHNGAVCGPFNVVTNH